MSAIFDSIRSIRFRRGPQRILGGVAGGIASRFGLNVWLVRLLVLVSFLLPVLGWILYAVIWLITPWRDNSIPLERMLNKNRPSQR
ncbi:PspC domain-containing protein [Enteractinococcus coprophilus]|uniref:Phage shock protein C (PspC) family protein n=1 Tax=Enteractinococcus coprophilus TaxID=1027633 RepID=A0A543AG83_9MICC|nr:PspC domain-containing protein [Enteractinococcus coprophilus]TQL71593.1 phage shock protein C (PspC) family protein [Enteractinococcus coprophilus]